MKGDEITATLPQILLKGPGTFCPHERVGVLAGWQRHDVDAQPALQKQLDAAQRRLLAGRVGVEKQHHTTDVARQQSRLIGRERRAAGRHHVLNAGLVQRNDVGVALHQDGFFLRAQGLTGLVEPVQNTAFMIDGRFGRVDVFGLFGIGLQQSSTEADYAACVREDRKHEPVTKAVIVAMPLLAGKHQPGLFEHFRTDAGLGGGFQEGIPGVRRIAQSEAADGFRINAALFQIGTGHLSGLGYGKLLEVEAGRKTQCMVQGRTRIVGLFFAVGKRDAGALGQHAHGLHKANVLDLLDEGEHVAAASTAEALEDAQVRIDAEGRGFFLVEGTQPEPVRPPAT